MHTKREISIATFTFYHLQTVFWLTADLAPGPSNSLFQILMPIPWQPGQDEQKENNPDNTVTMFHMESSAHTTSLASSLLLDATQVDHTCTIAQMHIKKVFSIFISDSPFFPLPGRYFLCDRLCDLACPQGFLAPPPPLPHLHHLLSLLRPTWASHPPPSRGQSKATPVGPWTHLQAESSRQPWKHSWPCFRLALQSLWPELWINQWTGSTLLREKAKLYMQPLWNAYSLQQCIKWPCLWEPCW